jgi:hypothetical protein
MSQRLPVLRTHDRDGGDAARDITCDGSVMAETAEIRRCDGVMDRIASFSDCR